MSQTVSMIGVQPDELVWLRMLVCLLRHPDPAVAELTRQALLYLSGSSDGVSGSSGGHDRCEATSGSQSC